MEGVRVIVNGKISDVSDLAIRYDMRRVLMPPRGDGRQYQCLMVEVDDARARKLLDELTTARDLGANIWWDHGVVREAEVEQ